MTVVNDAHQRRHPRLEHLAQIKVTVLSSSREFLATMRDFSESGLFFLICPFDPEIELGSLLTVQTTEIEDAPVQKVSVVRMEKNVGYGVQFVLDEDDAAFD
jgi:PilZ domain